MIGPLMRLRYNLAKILTGSPVSRVVSFPSIGTGWRSPSGTHNATEERLTEANQNWAGICADLISDSVARIPMLLWEERANGEWERVEQHPALDLYAKPNHAFDGYKLRKLTEMSRIVYGNALWWLNKPTPNMAPEEIYFVPWDRVTPVRDEREGIVAFRMQKKAGFVMLPAEECIHFEHPSIEDMLVGRSEFMMVADAIDLGQMALKSNTSLFRNGASVSSVLEFPEEDELSESQKKEYYRQFQEGHAGFDRAHFPLILEGGVKFHQMKPGGADIDFAEAMQKSMEQVLASFRVPPAVLGMTGDFNRANMEAALYSYQQNALAPRAAYWYGEAGADCHSAGKIENEYMPHWSAMGRRVWRVTPKDFIDRNRDQDRADLRTYLGEGTGKVMISRNEARERSGMDPLSDPASDDVDGWPMPAPAGMPVAMDAGRADRVERAVSLSAGDYAEWKRFAREHSRLERVLHAIYRDEFKRQEAEVIKRLTRIWPKAHGLVAGWSEGKARRELAERKDLVDSIFPAGETAKIVEAGLDTRVDGALEAARRMYAQLGLRVTRDEGPALGEIPGVNDPILESAIREFLREVGFAQMTEVTQTTIKKIRRAVVDVLAVGGSLNDVVDQIRQVYEEIDRSRAFTIARTEMTGAWSYGQLEAASSLEFEVTKRWLPAIDERTRDAHLAMATSDPIAMNEKFDVGGEMLTAPGDPSGSPGNIINCRCTLVFEEREEIN